MRSSRRFWCGAWIALSAWSAPAADGEGSLSIDLTVPDAVAVGESIVLRATLTNVGDESLIVRVPVLDARSFDFRVRFDDHRDSLYTAFHPGAGQGSNLAGDDLNPGQTLEFVHEVPAVKAGSWSFQAQFHGAKGIDTVTSERRTVAVSATEQGAELRWSIETGAGTVVASFWPEVAPATALHVAVLTRDGFYDGTEFHRIIQGFMIQGGVKSAAGAGYSIAAEFNDRPHVAGVLSMARLGDPQEADGRPPADKYRDSARTSFFVCDGEASYLDGRYTAFGAVAEGMDVVHEIAATPVMDNGYGEWSAPEEPVVMTKVRLVVGG